MVNHSLFFCKEKSYAFIFFTTMKLALDKIQMICHITLQFIKSALRCSYQKYHFNWTYGGR